MKNLRTPLYVLALGTALFVSGCTWHHGRDNSSRYPLQTYRDAAGQVHVQLPDCPNWDQPYGLNAANETTSNFGCADARNFALMIAYPEDLANPPAMTPDQGNGAVLGQQRYSAGKTKPLLETGLSTEESSQ